MPAPEAATASVAEDLAANGAIVVRQFLSAEETANLRPTVDEIYGCMAVCRQFDNRKLGENFRICHGVWLEHLPEFLRSARPDLERRYGRSLAVIEAQTRRLLGEQWRFFAKRSYFRRHFGVAKQVPWHIDADAAAIYRLAASVVNVWLPLNPVGEELPSLEIVPGSHLVMRRTRLLIGKDRYRDDAFVCKIGAPSTPRLQPGDALIFDQFLLHRTQLVGAKKAVRTACEFRFIRPAQPTLVNLTGRLRFIANALFAEDGIVAGRIKLGS